MVSVRRASKTNTRDIEVGKCHYERGTENTADIRRISHRDISLMGDCGMDKEAEKVIGVYILCGVCGALVVGLMLAEIISVIVDVVDEKRRKK